MSGHSKWATTKHKKAAIDAKRGKMFAKLIKNIEVAARTGGGDPSANPTLYDAIQKAKKTSVPNDNIDRAVKRGSGAEGGGADYQAITYEGYAPGGVAVLIECLTDNKNRAAGEVRTAMNRNGGAMADPGSVSYLFNRKGVILVPKEQSSGEIGEDDLLLAVLEAGAEEVNDYDENFEVVCEPGDLVAVRTALQDAGIDYDSAEAGFVPSMNVEVDADGARKVLRIIDALEDSDDVQNVYSNFDASDEVMAEVGVIPAVIAPLRPEDAGEALTVQYAAYLAEGRRYGTTDIPPLVETCDELGADLRRPDVVGFAARLGPRLVGSVRLRGVGGPDPVAFVRFSVAPDVQGRGIGAALIDAAHAVLLPGTRSWLVTGVDSAENLALYRRRGYAERGRERDAAGVALVRMERTAP